MDDLSEHYKLLGLRPDASPEEIKQTYRDLAHVWHPDRFLNNPRLQQKANEKMKEINHAYEILMDALQGMPTPDEIRLKAAEYCNSGHGHFNLKNYTQAVKDYDKAIELNPRMESAYFYRGTAHHYLENYTQAIKDQDKFIELNPKMERAYFERGATHFILKNYTEAIKDYDKLIELNKTNARAFWKRSLIYGRIGNKVQSKYDLQTAAELGHVFAQIEQRKKKWWSWM
jgi:curved DNA-binding protein CbpA